METVDQIVVDAVAELRLRVPEYWRALVAAGDDPRAVSAATVRVLLAALSARRAAAWAVPTVRRLGRRRCQAGVALDSLLEAIALHREVVAEALERRGRQLGLSGRELQRAERRLHRVAADLGAALARGYMDALGERGDGRPAVAAAMVRIATAVNRSLDVGEVSRSALAAACEAVAADAGLIWLSGDDGRLALAYTHGLRWDEDRALRAAGAGPGHEILERARSAAAAVTGLSLSAGRPLLRAVAAVGARSPGQLVAVLAVGSRRPRTFTATQLAILTSAGDLLAAALARAQQHRREARTDYLTGLANRAEFERTLRSAIAGAERHGRPVALVLVDLDGLKAINDRHGHAGGDCALRAAAGALVAAVRATDTCARIGGDEFAIAMPDTTDVQASEVPSRVEAALQRSRPADLPAPLRLSFGVAAWERGLTAQELFRIADQRLYEHKRARRAGRAIPD